MTKLIIKTKQTTEHEVEIYYPCFMKNPKHHEYLGIIDADNVIRIYKTDDEGYMTCSKGKASTLESDIVIAHNEWHSCTEEDFFDVLADVQIKISLQPVLKEEIITTNNLYSQEAAAELVAAIKNY